MDYFLLLYNSKWQSRNNNIIVIYLWLLNCCCCGNALLPLRCMFIEDIRVEVDEAILPEWRKLLSVKSNFGFGCCCSCGIWFRLFSISTFEVVLWIGWDPLPLISSFLMLSSSTEPVLWSRAAPLRWLPLLWHWFWLAAQMCS